MNPNDPSTGAVVAPAPQRLIRLPGALQERNFRRFWVGETVSLFGDQATLIALPLVGVLVLDASAAQMGYLDRGDALPEPALLAARRRLGRPPRPPAPDDDRHRARPRGRAGGDPDRLRVRRADADPALRRQLPDRDAERVLLRLVQHALRDARAAGALSRGELAAERQPRLLVRRRAEPRRSARADLLGAGRAGRRRALVRLLGADDALDPPAGAADRERRGAAT